MPNLTQGGGMTWNKCNTLIYNHVYIYILYIYIIYIYYIIYIHVYDAPKKKDCGPGMSFESNPVSRCSSLQWVSYIVSSFGSACVWPTSMLPHDANRQPWLFGYGSKATWRDCCCLSKDQILEVSAVTSTCAHYGIHKGLPKWANLPWTDFFQGPQF